MKPRSLLLILIAFFAITTQSKAQSIYHDAMELANLLSQDFRVILDLSNVQNPEVFKSGVKLEKPSSIIELDYFNYYEIRGLNSSDAIILKYGADSVQLPSFYSFRFINLPTIVDWQARELRDEIPNIGQSDSIFVKSASDQDSIKWKYAYDSDDASEYLYTRFEGFDSNPLPLKLGKYRFQDASSPVESSGFNRDSLVVSNGQNSLSIGLGEELNIDSQGIRILKANHWQNIFYKKNAYKIAKILGSQSNFTMLKKGDLEFSLEAIKTAYRENLFLRSELDSFFIYHNPIFTYLGVDKYILYDSISNHINSNYAWQHILYSDSLLKTNLRVSQKDVIKTYRNPIPSSTDKLDNLSEKIKSQRVNVLNARDITVALSDFIVERAQEELNIGFFEKFQKKLNENIELTTLFPNTTGVLGHFEMSYYRSFIDYAKQAFTKDLQSLHHNFSKLLKLEKYRELKYSPEIFNLYLIYNIGDLVYEDSKINEILSNTYLQIVERQEDLSQKINLQLAEQLLNNKNEK